MAQVAQEVVNLSKVSSPEQFTFVLQLAVRPSQGFGKCSPQSFSVRRELFEFHTRKFKSFQKISLSFRIQ